jgi:DNA-dependent RNA polymerase auxiliary subunit epsilon
MKTHKTYADLIKLTQEVRMEMEKSMPSINREIRNIIKDNKQDISAIEKILDDLLNYSQLCIGESAFKRINQHYATFNPENAEAYTKIYKAITEE